MYPTVASGMTEASMTPTAIGKFRSPKPSHACDPHTIRACDIVFACNRLKSACNRDAAPAHSRYTIKVYQGGVGAPLDPTGTRASGRVGSFLRTGRGLAEPDSRRAPYLSTDRRGAGATAAGPGHLVKTSTVFDDNAAASSSSSTPALARLRALTRTLLEDAIVARVRS